MSSKSFEARKEELRHHPDVLGVGLVKSRQQQEYHPFREEVTAASEILGRTLQECYDLLKLHRDVPARMLFQFELGSLLVSVDQGHLHYLLTSQTEPVSVTLWHLLEGR